MEAAINNTLKTVPDCLAVGVVDITTGMLLAVKTTDSHPHEVLDLVAAATGDLYQGTNVLAIEQAFKKIRGIDDNSHYFREVIVTSENLLHIFQRGKRNQDIVMVIVCPVNVNLGMALTKARSCLAPVEAKV